MVSKEENFIEKSNIGIDQTKRFKIIFEVIGLKRINSRELVIKTIQTGFPIESLTSISRYTGIKKEKVYGILHVKERTIQRKKKEKGKLTHTESDIAYQILDVYTYGIEVFGENQEEFNAWLNRSLIPLNNQKPIDLLDTYEGRKAIMDILHRIKFTLY